MTLPALFAKSSILLTPISIILSNTKIKRKLCSILSDWLQTYSIVDSDRSFSLYNLKKVNSSANDDEDYSNQSKPQHKKTLEPVNLKITYIN
jgi:hypothetical protein